jgi:hypothetical protein
MAEQVNTGGVMQFNYGRTQTIRLDPERREAIEAGYIEANERKKREKKNKMILLIFIALIILLIAGYFILRK